MFPIKPDRPYFDAWLRRTRRQFAISGRLSQLATILAAETGETPEQWSLRLRELLDGGDPPSLDLLMRIDLLLSAPATPAAKSGGDQQWLF